MDYLDTFSQFAAGITYEALGSDIHEQVGWILADTVGAMVAMMHVLARPPSDS